MNLLAVNFHYFREEKYTGGIYPISKVELQKQLDEIAKSYQFIGQNEVIDLLKNKQQSTKNYCVITIDDGLKEQMQAFDFLNEMGVPSILYVPTYPLKHKKVLDVHKLHYVRTKMNDNDLYDLLNEQYQIDKIKFDEMALANQYRYDSDLSRKVKYFLNFSLSPTQKKVAIDFFFSKLVEDEHDFSSNLYMNDADLIKLAKADSLGSHGENHLPLATLAPQKAALEIAHASQYLESITNQKITSFSYPYGGKDAVNDSIPKLFDATDIEFAFTMWRGLNTEHDLKNQPYLLKRIDTNDAPGGKNNSFEYSFLKHD